MIVFLLRFLLVAALVAAFLFLLAGRWAGRLFGPAGGRKRSESCPSCEAAISVSAKDPGRCPSCGADLVRSPDGGLRIRIR